MAVSVTVSFSLSVVVAVIVMVNNWLGLIGVTTRGAFDAEDGVVSEVEGAGADALSVGACGLASVVDEPAVDDEVVSGTG